MELLLNKGIFLLITLLCTLLTKRLLSECSFYISNLINPYMATNTSQHQTTSGVQLIAGPKANEIFTSNIVPKFLHSIRVTLEKVSLHLSTLFTFTCCIWSTSTKSIACTLVTISSHEGVVGLHCIMCYNLRSCFISDVHCIFSNMGIYMHWDTVWFGVCWRKWSIPLHFNHRWILLSNFQILGWGEGACMQDRTITQSKLFHVASWLTLQNSLSL